MNALTNWLRRTFGMLERRWIADPLARARHQAIVHRRLRALDEELQHYQPSHPLLLTTTGTRAPE